MSHDHTFCNTLLQCFNKDKIIPAQPDYAASLEQITKNDIYRILEIIHLSPDSHLQIKLISILTIYMMSNGTDREIIIKYNPLYDKICEILTKGHQKKSNITLNFLASLLHTDDGGCTRNRALVLYAQNMIRASGCLMVMVNLFTNGLLHQDTWQALCRCLSDSCSGSESNQNYCSHLIPVCVRRCRSGNEYVFQVVHSLLINNEKNIELFLKSGGTLMFNREFLKYDRCLQLLNTVVTHPNVRDRILKDTDIIADLQDLKQLYGSTSQGGQWISVIFYTLNLKGQDYIREEYKTRLSDKKNANELDVESTNVLHVPVNTSMNTHLMDDTSELLKNIITEVFNYKQHNIKPHVTTKHSLHSNNTDKFIESMKDSVGIQKLRNNNNTSFLLNNNSVKSSTNLNYIDDKENYSNKTNRCSKVILKKREAINKSRDNTQKSIIDFKPKCASTPKQGRTNRANNFTSRPIHKPYKKQYKTFSFDSKLKNYTKTNKDESVQKRFGASRILDVINETCTTIMKSVTNVFRSKKTEDSVSQSENSSVERQSRCANSFTDYMRQRDAMLEQDSTHSHWDELMEEVQYECKTCNDTLSLKRKFLKDDFLKDTVNKLKLGINLYGCNFKKISKTFWRDQNYMTPLILYNLYRKLILK